MSTPPVADAGFTTWTPLVSEPSPLEAKLVEGIRSMHRDMVDRGVESRKLTLREITALLRTIDHLECYRDREGDMAVQQRGEKRIAIEQRDALLKRIGPVIGFLAKQFGCARNLDAVLVSIAAAEIPDAMEVAAHGR